MVLTHLHVDHLDGIAAFKDIPIIASQKAVELYLENEKNHHYSKQGREWFVENQNLEEKTGKFTLSKEWHTDWAVNYVKAKVYPPTLGVKEELAIGNGDERFLFRPIGGHTECSSYLINENKGILIAGDNFNCEHADNSLCMLNSAIKFIDVLKKFEELDFNTIVPGHGKVVDKGYLTKTRQYLEEMSANMKKLKAKNTPVEEAINDPSLPSFFEEKLPQQMDSVLKFWYIEVN